MRRLLRLLLLKPVLWASNKFSSRPEKGRIFEALAALYKDIFDPSGKKGIVIPFELSAGKFIIFSDQHKGARNGADDFMMAEPNYLAALQHYHEQDFFLIALGDCEELWENNLGKVKKFNKDTFEAEKKFIARNAFVKILGNHDLYWGNDPFAGWQLQSIYGTEVKIYEGVCLATTMKEKELKIYCTHGHQGDAQSDGNWFSKFFVSRIWAPFQAYLRINPNTASYNDVKKTLHNEMMYEWSASQKDILLITGHTHQPVFESLTHIERLYRQYQIAKFNNDADTIAKLYPEIRKREDESASVSVDYMGMKPSYFNSGCCCFADGDITGIEIEDGCIRLIKWTAKNKKPQRELLEEITLAELCRKL